MKKETISQWHKRTKEKAKKKPKDATLDKTKTFGQ